MTTPARDLNLSYLRMANSVIDNHLIHSRYNRETSAPLSVYRLHSILYLIKCHHLQNNNIHLNKDAFPCRSTGVYNHNLSSRYPDGTTIITSMIPDSTGDTVKYDIDSLDNSIVWVQHYTHEFTDAEMLDYIISGARDWEQAVKRGHLTISDMLEQRL